MIVTNILAAAIIMVSLLNLYINALTRAEARRNITELLQYFQQGLSQLRGETGRSINEQNLLMEQRLENIRNTLDTRLSSLQKENNRQLSQMRDTVDEKLQKTLEERISKSFKLVSERLEQVYQGLGEMQTLAAGVGDLKKVLTNVKTRGILGEIQLGAILEQILSPEQYEENFTVKNGARVEFVIKLPGDGIIPVYLPIDAKFPSDSYTKLLEAYESGNPVDIDIARKNLVQTIKTAGKGICEKYIDPPLTTDFAIMFLPVEGLYSEVVRLGLIEHLQTFYKISIAGPTTMAAMLNSLCMGFKTLAMQKRSSEVWQVLGAVKTEFERFENVLLKTQKRLEQANSELDTLIGVRTRMIMSRLNDVTVLPEHIPSESTLEQVLAAKAVASKKNA